MEDGTYDHRALYEDSLRDTPFCDLSAPFPSIPLLAVFPFGCLLESAL